MAKNPLVTVIIAVYHAEKYMERCVRSLFEQTLDDMEFIFVDDCTDDASIDILKAVLRQYPNRVNQVIIHKMDKNSGQAAVRKWAMLHASGDYVIHCDSDDWVSCDMYEKMYNEAISSNSDLIICDYFLTDGKTHKYISDWNTNFMPQGPMCTKMVKRSIYLHEHFIYPVANKAEDCVLVTQYVILSAKITHIPQAYYYYFVNTESICHNVSDENCLNNFQQEKQNVDLRIAILKQYNVFNKYKSDVLRWKYAAQTNLNPLLQKKKYCKLWFKSFPFLVFQILFAFRFPIHYRLIVLKKNFKVLFNLI